jgi:adenylate cyclase
MEKTDRVVLFCDIRQFARIARGLGDGMVDFIQAFYELVGDSVIAHGGKLLKYMGDSVLALFSASGATSAVRAAMQMRSRYTALSSRAAPGFESSLEISIGLGPVLLGAIGHSSLRGEDVFGETVNTTAMLMHGAGITVDARVAEAVGTAFRLERRDDVPLKWRPEPAQSWRVLEAE